MSDELVRLARACDLQPSYFDLQGNEVVASHETLLAALRAMGVAETIGDVHEALRRVEESRWRWSIAPVTVAWEGEASDVMIRVPDFVWTWLGKLRIECKDGRVIEHDLRFEEATRTQTVDVAGGHFIELRIGLPPVPLGCHRLFIDVAGERLQSLIVAAPRKTFAAARGRAWGVFLPLYALHSKRSWGIGDYTDLRRLIEWAGAQGASVVATLPLLPTFLESPFEPCPYQAVSRLFWNEVFVDPENAPRAEPRGNDRERDAIEAELAARARGLLAAREVDYATVMRLKREALSAQARALEPESDAARTMRAYLASRPEVGDYAAFRAALERLGPDWRLWPQRQREGELRPEDYDGETARYFEYTQWRAHSQMFEARDAAASLGMRSYLDLPVGVHRQGYDAWRYRGLFAQGMSVGAPPDLLARTGQNWNFQPLIPQALRQTGYEYVLRYLRHYFASAKMLRIDHAIGLHRLYWIPDGASGRDGVFVRQPAEEMYAILCLESMRAEAVVVAEDLGLVPPEVSEGLAEHGISGMYVQMFEMTGKREQPVNPEPEHAVASFSTHDLPPFAAYWQDEDLQYREKLGLLAPERVAEEKAGREHARGALVAHLRQRGLVGDEPDVGEVFLASTALLAEGDAEWVMLNLEDAWGETRAQNLPGTTSEQHSNWVSRAACGLDDFDSVEGLTKAIETVKLYRSTDNKAGASAPARSRDKP